MSAEPRRNLISFIGKCIPLEICNEYVKQVYNKLVEIAPDLFRNDTSFELRANMFNYSLRIVGEVSPNSVKVLLENAYSFITLVYLEITNPVTKMQYIPINNLYLCKYGIYYIPVSFRQPDDAIRDEVEKFIRKAGSEFENFVFIGGECVLAAKILKYVNALFYTDMQTILLDIKKNIKVNNKNVRAGKIDYEKYPIVLDLNSFFVGMRYCVLVNTGKSGMGYNLAKQLATTLCTRIAIISCNRKTLVKDCEILRAGGYIVKYQFVMRTNYEVTFTILE